MPDAPTLEQSRAWCRHVTRTRAGNFYHGLRLLPEPRRSDLYTVYAWMRVADDLADGGSGDPLAPDADAPLAAGVEADPSAARAALDTFREDTHRAIFTPALSADRDAYAHGTPYRRLWPAVARLFEDYTLDPLDFDAMIAGQLLDQEKTTYRTFEELYDYCYKVASSVGLVCVSIWGHADGPDYQRELRSLAEYRGIAFQLTNILRDLAEDAQRGRCYLPSDELHRFRLDAAGWPHDVDEAAFDRFMRFQIERALHYYELAAPLERQLSPETRATSWAMNQIYFRLLKRIDANPRAVLRRRVRLSAAEKLGIALRARWKRTW